MFISVIGFTEKEVWDQMKVRRQKMFQSLEFVRDNYPELSKKMDLSVKNKVQNIIPNESTLQEYRKRILKPGVARANRPYWMSNRLGKGDDVWTKPVKWTPRPKSFVNGCGLTPGKILSRLEIMVSGRAALCCDMSYDRNFPIEQTNYGNVFDIGIEGVWANLTKEHQLIFDQKFSEKKTKLICNNCDRAGINSMGWDLNNTILRQKKIEHKYFNN
jgi:hypothetical protein